MIIGIGHDLVDQRRIETLLHRFGTKFVQRICTAEEQADYHHHKNRVSFISGRFAVKEAVYKALGCADQSQLRWHHASTRNMQPSAAPCLTLSGACLTQAHAQMPQNAHLACHVSITDEPPYSSAMVVLSYFIK